MQFDFPSQIFDRRFHFTACVALPMLLKEDVDLIKTFQASPRGFLRENPVANEHTKITSVRKVSSNSYEYS